MLVLAVVALGVPLGSALADRVDAEVRSEARGQADVVASSAADLLRPAQTHELNRLARTAAAATRARVLIVDDQGRLLADSAGTAPGRSYDTRPEVAAALRGRADQRERTSKTLGERLLATAVPVIRNGRPVGAVRVTQSMDAVERAVRRAWLGLALVGLVVVALGLAAGWVIAAGVAMPLRRLDAAARRVAEGDLDARVEPEGSAEQRSLARTFNDMTARLKRMLASQREFVADASHQLRTPLAGLRLRLESARAESSEPHVREEVDAALTEVDRLSQMVSELLELSRAGEHELPAEPVGLRDAVLRAAQRWEGAAAGRDQRIVTEATAGGTVSCGRADLDRILDALIENALHYSPEHTTLTLAAREQGVLVLDEGPGLAAGEEETVFDRFHRGTAGRRGPGGTGLGLAIARELARRWGGDVMLWSRDDRLGAVAEVRMPPAT